MLPPLRYDADCRDADEAPTLAPCHKMLAITLDSDAAAAIVAFRCCRRCYAADTLVTLIRYAAAAVSYATTRYFAAIDAAAADAADIMLRRFFDVRHIRCCIRRHAAAAMRYATCRHADCRRRLIALRHATMPFRR